MDIRTERFDENSRVDEDGSYEYRYTGTTYIVRDGSQELVLRSYDSEPDVLTLVWPTAWTAEDLVGGLLARAVRLLRQQTSIRVVRLYNRMTGDYSDERFVGSL